MGKQYRWFFEPTAEFFLDDASGLRQLARPVAARIRLAIATKDGMDAVRDWRVGTRMAWDIQGDTTINYLVGVAIEAIVHARITSEMDLFSSAECRTMADTLIRIERTPDRFPTVIEGERVITLRWLDEMLPPGKPDALLDIIRADWNVDPQTGQPVEPEEPPEDEEERKQKEEERRQYERLRPQMLAIAGSPAAYEGLRASLRQEVHRWAEQFLRALRLPYSRQLQSIPETHRDANTPLDYFAEMFTPLRASLLSSYLSNRARRRLMIAHLMLRVYRLNMASIPTFCTY